MSLVLHVYIVSEQRSKEFLKKILPETFYLKIKSPSKVVCFSVRIFSGLYLYVTKYINRR